MNQPSPEEFYRQIHTGTPGDVEFYSRLVRPSDCVLELGCGSGRLTQALAPLCREITGIESNPEFCARARDAVAPYPNAHILHHDIRQAFPEGLHSVPKLKYDKVIAPYNLLYSLGGETGVASALKFVREQLGSDGEFWADVYPVDDMHAALLTGEPSPDDDDEPVGELVWQGERYPVIERSVLDFELQHLEVEYRAVLANSTERVFSTTTLEHDYLLLEQIERLLGEADLEVALLLAGFDGESREDEAGQLVLCAQRPSPA
jgi:SAM-dependent methyltransferase